MPLAALVIFFRLVTAMECSTSVRGEQLFVRPGQRVHAVVMLRDGEALKLAQELVIPVSANELDVASLALRRDGLRPHLLRAAGRGELHVVAVQRPRRRLRLRYACAAWVLHERNRGALGIQLSAAQHLLLDGVRRRKQPHAVLDDVEPLARLAEQQAGERIKRTIIRREAADAA